MVTPPLKYTCTPYLLQVLLMLSLSPWLQQEEEHLQKVLTRCKYPNWALNRIKVKIRSTTQKKKNKNQNKNTKLENCQQPYLVVPYYQGLSESH